MRARYFPHTHVPAAVADVLRRLFDEVAVTVAAGDDPVPEGFTALGPSAEEDQRLRGLLADWRHFSGLHGEGLSAYAMGMGRGVDPLDDQLTSQIKGELERRVAGGPTQDVGADAATAARALLSLAAEHDLRTRDLDLDMARIERMQQELLDGLRGEVEDLPEIPVVAESVGELRMLKRLSAWATLFVGEGEPCIDRVFVTTSREALELVAEHGASLEPLGVTPVGRFTGEHLASLLSGAPLSGTVGEAHGESGGPVTVRIFIVRREHPYNVYNGFVSGASVYPVKYQGQDPEINDNVLFVLVDGIALD